MKIGPPRTMMIPQYCVFCAILRLYYLIGIIWFTGTHYFDSNYWVWVKKYCAIYIQTKRYCLFGSCFTDIFFKFLSLLIPEWRQFKWFKLSWHVINQGWFLSLFKGFVKFMYGIWTKLCSYYKIQHLFYWALWV